MNRTIKVICVILCLILCVAFCLPVSAESKTPTITISNRSAMPGDEVTIDIDISNNPGIMGMTFSVTYDKDDFEYKGYTKGNFTSIQGTDKPDKGHIIFTVIESKDIDKDGTVLSVTFEIKEKAAPGKHIIAIANHIRDKYGYDLHNCFSNSKTQQIIPTVNAGSITVGETCVNAGHKYGEWTVTREADCTSTGLKNHTCSRCNYNEEVEIPITHDFESDWTVDKAATPTEDGIMSRHCTKCNAVTDEITFGYEEIGGDDTDNTSSDASNDTSVDNSDESEPEDNSSDESTDNKKPIINNTEGAKNPESAVENLKDYENLDKKEPLDSNTDQEIESDTDDIIDSPEEDNDIITDTTAESDQNSADKKDNSEKKFWQTGIGTIMILFCVLLGIAVIVFIIIKRRKR